MKFFSKKSSDIVFCILCLLFSVSLLSLLLFAPHEDFSERENRSLQKLPKLSFNTLANGSFFSKLSDFSADQFPFRSTSCSISSLSEFALLRQESNGVIVSKNGYLLVRPEYEDNKILADNLNAISSFLEANRHTSSFLIVAPRAIDVMSDSLPSLFYEDYGKNEYNILQEKIPANMLIDTSTSLKKLSEQGVNVWYKSDHHWTARGAYEAYLLVCNDLGLRAYPLEYFNTQCVSESFFGTSFSKSGLPQHSAFADTLELYRYSFDESVKITSCSTENTVYGFYDISAINTKDKYQIFLGGNFDHLQIRNEESKKEKMLIIKDSFANSLIPFFSLHYDIDVIDLRYYKASPKKLLEESNFDKILLIYGMDTLCTDTSCTRISK